MENMKILLKALGQDAEELSHINFDGKCENRALFQKILRALPHEPITLHLRNNTNIESTINVVEIDVGGFRDGWNRIYHMDVSLKDMFPEIKDWLNQNCQDGWIGIDTFINHGTTIARLLGRPFKITHQYGSGRPEEASYKDCGQFEPA